MPSARPTSWLPFATLIGLIALGLGWLLLGLAGLPMSGALLPDGANATVELASVPDRRLGIGDIERLPASAWHRLAERGHLSAAPHEVLWVRVTLRNPTARSWHGVLASDYFFTDVVELWQREGAEWTAARSGEAVAPSAKAIAGRDAAFPIEVPAGTERVLYLRADDYFRAFLRLAWWSDGAAYHDAKARGHLIEGIYFGGLLALLGYNVLLWLRLRQADLGYYVHYLAATGAFVALARAMPLAAGARLSSPALETVMTAAVALSAYFLTRFTREFLELAERLPRADRLARGMAKVLLVLAAGSVLTPWLPRPIWLPLTVLANGAAHLMGCAVAIAAWRAGVWQARFFILSFGFLFAGSLGSTIAWWWRLSPGSSMLGLMLGSMLEMLLLSRAVAERFAQTKQRLIEETEQRRMIEETYADELEIEVRERTHELEQANADKDRMLAVIGHDLRAPLTGLMRAADEATGEFAGQTARTGRALLLLIEDLVLWARLRAGTQVIAPHPARAVLAPAVALHHALAEHGGIALHVEVPADLRIATDLVLAQTLVRNLLTNALKFARTRVVLRAQAGANGAVRFTVGNDGPALSAEVAARIAADEDGPMTATGGLGLRLCREICRALGVKLEATAGADGGTEFSFNLQAAPTTAAFH